MRNLYLYEKAAYGCQRHAASGLQPFEQQDVSTVPGCIHRVLRSILRQASWQAPSELPRPLAN